MDNSQTPTPLSSSDTETLHPSSGSIAPVYPLRPFVTMPDNSTPPTSESSVTDTQLAAPLTGSFTRESNPALINGQPEPHHPMDAPIPATSNSPIKTTLNVTSPLAGSNSSLPSQSPTSNLTSNISDDARNTTVVVQAVDPSHLYGRETSGVPPPSRGAVIALGALTLFFVVLISGLLIWRKWARSKTGRKDVAGQMEAGLPSPNRKPEGPSAASLSKERNNTSITFPAGNRSQAAGATPSNPFGRRGITRASRPSSLHLDHRINNRGLAQVDIPTQRAVQHTSRPNSWRSSIANAWATLGLPSRVLHGPNAHVSSDNAPSVSDKSTRNPVNPSIGILEEQEAPVEPDELDSSFNSSDIASHPLHSSDTVSQSALSPETQSSFDTRQSDRQFDRTRHSKSSSACSLIPPSKNAALSLDQDSKSITLSVSESESQPSPVTTNEAADEPRNSYLVLKGPPRTISDVRATKLTGTPTPKPFPAKIEVDKLHPSQAQN